MLEVKMTLEEEIGYLNDAKDKAVSTKAKIAINLAIDIIKRNEVAMAECKNRILAVAECRKDKSLDESNHFFMDGVTKTCEIILSILEVNS